MNEPYISEHGDTITINTLAAPASEAFQKGRWLSGRVAIEEIAWADSGIIRPLHSGSSTVLHIEIEDQLTEKVGDDPAFEIQLICRTDEYVYCIPEDYLRLMEAEKMDDAEFLALFSPRIELLAPRLARNTHVSKLTKGKMAHLLKRTQAEMEKLAKRFSRGQLDVSAFMKAEGNRFYLVVDKLEHVKTTEESGRFLEFRQNGFQLFKEEEVPDPSPSRRLAIIVHGLASSIGQDYHDLARHLESSGYRVFGFDYLTINHPISDNGQQFAESIKRLKTKYPQSTLLVVAHSMGGLVARSAEVEHGAEIDQLLMAGTPNNGSILLGNQHLVRSLFLLAGIFKILPIKPEDYWQLIFSKDLRGLDDLANKSEFIDGLNAQDRLHYSKKYFSLAGKFEGLSHDIIVHSENMTKINGLNMPSIPVDKHHLEYFRGTGWHEPVDMALRYLE